MLKNLSCLEATVGEKIGRLYLDNDTQTAHVKEMLNQFLDCVNKIEEHVKEMQAKEAADKAEAEGETIVEPEIIQAI